jgi:DNA-directed RNA polymerase specialized sigma24 family protein
MSDRVNGHSPFKSLQEIERECRALGLDEAEVRKQTFIRYTAQCAERGGDPVSQPSPVAPPPPEEPYTEGMVRQIIRRFEYFETIADTGDIVGGYRSNVGHQQEELWCMFIDVDKGLRLLPLRQLKAIALCLIQGYTEDEAADFLRISRASVQDRIKVGVRNLTRLLNDCHHPLRKRGSVSTISSSRAATDAASGRRERARS